MGGFMLRLTVAASAALLISSSALAQANGQAALAAPQRATIVSPDGGNVLRAGVEIPLRLEESLDSNDKTVREGNRFRMTVASDVMLGRSIVIPAGSPATGEITDVRRKGMWGKSGRIVARVLSVRVGDRLVRLSGSFDDKGTTGTAGVVGAVVLLPVAGFFMTGTSAKIPAGSGVKAFLDEDLTIASATPAPAPQPAAVVIK
ncbi:hypothetical protein ABDK56_05010 [Sphingomonas sp. ASV193]|uniref:hypothetical protein n=1 Tax=Sphingomonas sp. ASV193 TaxID=3144405 RepID=UPI0032E8FA55